MFHTRDGCLSSGPMRSGQQLLWAVKHKWIELNTGDEIPHLL